MFDFDICGFGTKWLVSGWGMFTGAKTHRRFPPARHGLRSISAGFLKMACEVATFLKEFPGAVDIFLVNSERWTEYHKAIMEALTEGVRMFLRTRRHLPFEKLLAYPTGARRATWKLPNDPAYEP